LSVIASEDLTCINDCTKATHGFYNHTIYTKVFKLILNTSDVKRIERVKMQTGSFFNSTSNPLADTL